MSEAGSSVCKTAEAPSILGPEADEGCMADRGGARRPVWLFSLDSARYPDAYPLTTAGLKAYFDKFGSTAGSTDTEIVHFRSHLDVGWWTIRDWKRGAREAAARAVEAGLRPVVGISCYTWNTGEFLSLVRKLKRDVPELLVVAGGPQVQRAEDYVGRDGIDVVVMGEGEITFQEVLDHSWRLDQPLSEALAGVKGVCFGGDGMVTSNVERPRVTQLDLLPSALDALPLRDAQGSPLYRRVTYETVRGCPYSCAFCEWGTGATGTKMWQHSLDRIRSDLERFVEGGIEEIFFADSNFGQLHEDLEKARLLVSLKRETGRPAAFCTSWGKSHSPRVQETVRLLHENGLIEHYTLALQTLTAKALENSNRINMPVNRFSSVVEDMTSNGIPITTEMIWGLPGDTLAEFKAGVDRLSAVFPSVAIYGYTLLPGTEFFAKREQFQIQTVTLHEVGNWSLDYVVGSYSFSPEEGQIGYFLVTAHIIFNRGNLAPLTCRYLAMLGSVSLSDVLMTALRELLGELEIDFGPRPEIAGLKVYEQRDRIYRACLDSPELVFEVLRKTIFAVIAADGHETTDRISQILLIDQAFAPRSESAAAQADHSFGTDAPAIVSRLKAMQPPEEDLFRRAGTKLTIRYPEHAGHLLAPGDLPAAVFRGNHAVNP